MSGIHRLVRRLLILTAATTLAACLGDGKPESKPDPIGDFQLGYAIVVAQNATKGPLSREIEPEAIKTALTSELERVFRPYDGDRLYHVAIGVDAYVLALPGVPLVASPKSALILTVNIWDDAQQAKIIEENKQFTILESFSGKSIIGSGLTQTKEEQLANLARSAAVQIERWMRLNKEAFNPPEDASGDS